MDVNSALIAIPAMLLALAIPVVVLVLLVQASLRRLSGRRERRDRILGAFARAGVHASHLQADTPDVDDLSVPRAPRPGDRDR